MNVSFCTKYLPICAHEQIGISVATNHPLFCDALPEECNSTTLRILRPICSGFGSGLRKPVPWRMTFSSPSPIFSATRRCLRKEGEALRAWSVGCATGEEAYSLAILLVEAATRNEQPPLIQVFASDLHSNSLAKAREGFYPGDIATDVSDERLKRFFQKENGGYRIRKEIRDLVIFAPHNILSDPPYSRMDLISCRNLMIYLEREVQQDIIELFHYALNPDGVLLLGTAESIDSADLFRVGDKKFCYYFKRNVPSREPRLPVFPVVRTRFATGTKGFGQDTPTVAYGNVHRQMLELHSPPSILISPDNRIVHYSHHAGRYMNHPAGEPTTNVLRVIQEGLQIELQTSLHEAREQRKVIVSLPVPIDIDGHACLILLHVRPALEAEREGFVLVVFEERELPDPPEVFTDAEAASQRNKDRVQELEAELALARRHSQGIIREYENTREEMRSSQEEMQSANEELRSTMEELETSKEELQSVNEELQTVNQQNRHKVEELAQLSADLQNHLSSTDIATLFLDRELRIMRFTPKLSDLFNVRMTDQGRPIGDFTTRLGYSELEADAQSVLKHLTLVEREVEDHGGKWYLVRVLPYRSDQDRIDGVVITFIDIHQRKLAEEQIRKEKYYAETIIETLHEPLLVLTPDLHVRTANPAFYRNFHVDAERTLGRKVYDVGDKQWDIPALRTLLEEVLPEKNAVQDVEIEHTFDQIGRRVLFVSARVLNEVHLVLMGIRDLTEKKRSESELLRAEGNLRMINDALKRSNADLTHFSYALSHDMQEPSRMVVMFTQLIARELGDREPRITEYINHAVQGALRMQALLGALRDYWSIDELQEKQIAPVDCNTALQKALYYLEGPIGQSGAVISHDPLPTIFAEEYPLTLLFQNLIGNAIKYQPAETQPHVHITAERSEGEWVFSVTDNGIGIDEEHFQRIFLPFKRLHGKTYPGTGLGLAMCRRIAERFHGRIVVDSTLGQGSTFRFILPDLGGEV